MAEICDLFTPYRINIVCPVCDPTKPDPRRDKYVNSLKERVHNLEKVLDRSKIFTDIKTALLNVQIIKLKEEIQLPDKSKYIPDINTETWGCSCRNEL